MMTSPLANEVDTFDPHHLEKKSPMPVHVLDVGLTSAYRTFVSYASYVPSIYAYIIIDHLIV